MAKLTAATVNKALKAAGHAERLVQADGYAYFSGGDAPLWPEAGVYVNRITDVQDLQWWLDSYASLKAAYEANRLPKDDTPYRIGGKFKLVL